MNKTVVLFLSTISAMYCFASFTPKAVFWINRGPIEEDGGRNLYGFVENAPVNKIDPLGLNIYETTGNKNASWFQVGNRYLHQEICVDTWHVNPNNKCCKTKGSRRCFSFAATGLQFPWPSSTWLEFDSYQFGLLQGTVYETGDQGTRTSGTLDTTCQQDETFLAILRGMEDSTGAYSVLRHNCRTFSQQMFEDAKNLFSPQTKTSNSKCQCPIRDSK